jgi:RNA polymerase sigma-70 factor, ECF subfamily
MGMATGMTMAMAQTMASLQTDVSLTNAKPGGRNRFPAGTAVRKVMPRPAGEHRVTPTDLPQDQHLMRDIVAGNRMALAHLMGLHARSVALFAGRFLGNAADGDDITQEVFVRVWQQAARYDATKASVTTWIYRIATNLCIDRQRRNRFWRMFGRVQADDVADILPDDAPGATQTLAAKQRLARVRAGITTLPARQRMAILLTAVAEMETEAVAAVMKTSQGAVEQLLVRARRSLRAMEGDDDAG